MDRRSSEWIRRAGCLALVLWVGLGCGGPGPVTERAAGDAEPSAAASGDQLVLAIVASYPASALEELTLFSHWMNERLAADELRLAVKVAATVPEVASWLKEGEADFFVDSPHPVLLARALSGCRPILRRWKFGSPTYQSVFFVRDDSGIRDWSDLSGRILAFEDRYSASSFFLPMGLLLDEGIEGVFIEEVGVGVPEDRPAWVFSGGDSTTMHWVLAGKVAAGVMNEWNFNRFSGQDKDQLRVLATTEAVPRGLLAVRSDLDPEVERKVVELLLSANEDPVGREALEAFSATDRFDEIPPRFLERVEPLQELVVQIDAMVRDMESSSPAEAP